MATYADLTTNLKLQWIDTEDAAATQRAIIEVTPDGASMELPRGLRGEKGEKGDTGAALMFRYLVTSFADLPKDLTQEDQGAAFPDVGSRSLWVWTGSDYFEIPNFIGLKGDTGATPELVVGSVTMGGEAQFNVNPVVSIPERVVFDVQLPQGPQGIQGPPGPQGPASDSAKITESPDYDNSTAPTVGDTIMWNGTKWEADTIALNAADVGAAPATHTHTMVQIEDLPTISTNSLNGHVVQRQTSGHIEVPPSPSASTHAASKSYVDSRAPAMVRQEVTGTNGVTVFEKRGNVVHVASAGTNAGVTIPTDFRPTQVRRVAVSTGVAATNVGSCTLNTDGTITGGWAAGSAFSYLIQ